MFLKLLIERAIRSAIAASLATISVGIANASDWHSVKTLLIASIAAGVSATITLLSQLVGDIDSTSFLSTKKL